MELHVKVKKRKEKKNPSEGYKVKTAGSAVHLVLSGAL